MATRRQRQIVTVAGKNAQLVLEARLWLAQHDLTRNARRRDVDHELRPTVTHDVTARTR